MTTSLASKPRVAIRHARSAAEIDAVLRARHHVYSVEHDYFERRHDERIYDRFDTFPQTTVHLVAELDGSIAGGVRYCMHEPHVGLPVDDYYDFSRHVSTGDVVACGGMLFVTCHSERRGIATSLILAGDRWATANGASVVVGVVNPMITSMVARLDYQAVARPQHRDGRLPFVPVVKRLRRTPAGTPTTTQDDQR